MTPVSAYAGRERRLARPSPLLVALALTALAAIAYATLCPIGLRPHLGGADQERFGAFFLLGGLVALAAGRRWVGATAAVALVAFGLEAAQGFMPDRDPRLADAMVKVLGGAAGVALAQLLFPIRRLVLRAGAGRPRAGRRAFGEAA